MTDKDFEAGERSAGAKILGMSLHLLGYDGSESRRQQWILEREAAIAALRAVCGEFGDNDWEPSSHLRDIIEKHLHRHLE